MFVRYREHLIEPFQSAPRRWRAMVRRSDGRAIKTADGEFPFIATGGIEAFTPDDAIEIAKKLIDGLRRQDVPPHIPTRH